MNPLREALRDLPGADLLESDSSYLLVVDVAGASEETVDATVDGGRLRLEARREKAVPPEFNYRREERPVFLDADLPLPPDAGHVEGIAVERGVLEVTVGKRRE